MIYLSLQSTNGSLFWHSSTAPSEILNLASFWSVSADTFCSGLKNPSVFSTDTIGKFNSALTGSIHGRTCYLGFEHEEGRHYFAKGIGWTWSNGWSPSDGSYGIFPLWGAERERDFSFQFMEFGIDTARPEAIFLHGSIPDATNSNTHCADMISDLDGTPAKPCMYVYSSSSRWRIADLAFLSDSERDKIWNNKNDKNGWLRFLLLKLAESCRLLHRHGGHDYSLSPHNSFIDGKRIDFEYAVLPEFPHKEKSLNLNSETWKEKELDGLREIAWYLADIMQLDISGKELNKLWIDAYRVDDIKTHLT